MNRNELEALAPGLVCIAVAVATIVLACWAVVADNREWREFAKAHDCKVTAKVRGDTFTTFGVGANGQTVVGVGSTPDKIGYTCNDGVTYFR